MRWPLAGLMAVALLLHAVSLARAANGPSLPTPPKGWKLEIIATAPAVRHPSVVCCAPDGRVFVAEDPMDISLPSADAAQGRIVCIHPDGRVTTFADKLHAVFGMQYLDGRLYALHNPRLTVFTDDEATGVGRDRRDLIESTNPNPWALNWNDHVPANFRLAMDGFFYLAVGDKGLYGAVGTDGKRLDLRGGGVVRLRPDGSGLEVFSTGVRNILDVALNDEDEVFTYDNTDEHDWMGRLTHMVDGGFYGYPYDFVPRRPYTLWMMADYGAGAATGTLCYNDDALPADYRGNLFLSDFGKRNILRVRIERDGVTYKAASREDLFTDVPPDFRPVGIAFSADGLGIYVCDWQHVDTKETVQVGRLLKLTHTGPSAAPPRPAWCVQAAMGKPFEASPPELLDALSHPAHAVRMIAQRRLVDRGAAIVPALAELLKNSDAPPHARRHALWALDAIDGGTAHAGLIETIAAGECNADLALRRQAIRQLGTRRVSAANATLVGALRDHDASIRFHAATALGRIAGAGAAPVLMAALSDSDMWVKYAVVTALNRTGRAHPDVWERIAAGLRSPDERVWNGCAFALRDTYDGRLVAAVASVAGATDAPPAARAVAVSVLGPLHHKLPEWKGEWWAYHPALSPPPRKTVEWEGTPVVLNVLRGALGDPDRQVVLAALGALRDAGDPSAAEPLRRLARGNDPELATEALRALATCDDGKSADFLKSLLAHPGQPAAHDAEVIETLGKLKAAGAADVLLPYARGSSDRLRTAALEALVRIGGDAGSSLVARLLDDPSVEVRRAAARAAGDLGDRSLIPKLLTAYAAPQTRDAAAGALAQMPDARAAAAYLEGLASTDFARREKCRQALREVRDAVLPAVEAAEKSLSDEAVLELRQVYQDHSKAKGGPVFARAITRKHPEEYLGFALDHAGDARKGQALFAAATTAGGLGCAVCHVVNGAGGTVGPDLSGIGAKYSRRDLAEAVLYPSKAVREGYQQIIVRTRSGQTYAGPVKADTADELTLQESDGTLRRVGKADIAARKDTGLSPMPEGLHAGLSPQQFADLVSYLESLKQDDSRGAR